MSSTTAEIDAKMKHDHNQHRHTQTLIFMGISSSGKSTILQQLKHIYLDSPIQSSQMLQDNINEIRTSCCSNALILCYLMDDIKHYKQLSKLSIDNDTDLPEIAIIINNIWKQNRAKNLYSQRWINKIYSANNITMDDNINNYFSHIDTIMSTDYAPTAQDIILSHQHCNHLQTLNYEFKENLFTAIDIPSNFNTKIPKKLWVLFDSPYFGGLGSHNNDTLIYIADLSRYCKVGKDKYNALEIDLNMFHNIVNNKFLRRSEIILILNKEDIFCEQLSIGMPFVEFMNEEYRQKYENLELLTHIGSHECMMAERAVTGFIRNIYGTNIGKDEFIPVEIIEMVRQYVNRNKQFPTDTEEEKQLFDATYQCAVNFIEQLFIEQDQLQQSRQIFTMVASATDRDCLERIFWDVQNITVRRGS